MTVIRLLSFSALAAAAFAGCSSRVVPSDSAVDSSADGAEPMDAIDGATIADAAIDGMDATTTLDAGLADASADASADAPPSNPYVPRLGDAPEGCAPGLWCWEYPVPAGEPLYGVWAPTADSAWAVGAGGAILRYASRRWSLTPSVTTETLRGAWGASANDGWAWGYDPGISGAIPASGVLLHWDGARWDRQRPDARVGVSRLMGSASNDVWAHTADATSEGLARWDGARWTAHASPVMADESIADLCVRSPREVWVAARRSTSPTRTRVLRYDGARWAEAFTVDDAMNRWGALGCPEDGAALVALAEGAAPPGGSPMPARVVRGTSAGAVSTVAIPAGFAPTRLRVASNGALLAHSGSTLYRWTGSAFAVHSTLPVAAGVTADLEPSGRSGFVVTETGQIVPWLGDRWGVLPIAGIRQPQMLVGPRGRAPQYAAGIGSLFVRERSGAWTFLAGGLDSPQAVWQPADGVAWIAGTQGNLLRITDHAVAPVPSGTTGFISAMHGAAPDDGWLATARPATLRHWDGTQWADPPVPLPASVTIGARVYSLATMEPRSLWAVARGDFWIGYRDGIALHFDGVRWTAEALPGAGFLYTIEGADTGELWASSSGGIYRRAVGAMGWTRLSDSPQPNSPLFRVRRDGAAYFGGARSVHRWNAGTGAFVELAPVSLSNARGPSSLWVADDGDVWVSSSYGAIVRRVTDGR